MAALAAAEALLVAEPKAPAPLAGLLQGGAMIIIIIIIVMIVTKMVLSNSPSVSLIQKEGWGL